MQQGKQKLPPRVKDIAGQRFWSLIAVKFVELQPNGKKRSAAWRFKCDCGTEVIKRSINVTRGNSKTCGSPICSGVTKDLSDKKFGLWKAISLVKSKKNNREATYWNCICECGTKREVISKALRDGISKSCGCLHKKTISTHGHATGGKISKTYVTYMAMKTRCHNKKHKYFKNYGGRGIKICDRWLGKDGFLNFLGDMEERPEGKTIDRRNPDGNYEPGNCRWATPKEQRHNRRLKKGK